MINSNHNPLEQQSNKLRLRKELKKYLKYWYWFLVGIVFSLLLGYFYLRYTTPVYSAAASIIINQETTNSSKSDMPDLGLATGLKTNDLDKELAILRSRRLMREVVKSLNLHISYFVEGKVRDVEVYKDIPFTLKVLKLEEENQYGDKSFKIALTGKDRLLITNLTNMKVLKAESGSPVDLGFASVVIIPNKGVKSFKNITMTFSEIDKVAAIYRNNIKLIQEKESSNVIMLGLEDPVAEKAMDIIDQLIFEFNRDAIEDKNLIAGNTANFINDRLDIINDELEFVESGKEEFKESNRLTDIQSESQMFVQTASEYNRKRQEIGTQLELVNAMLDYLSSSSNSELLPANLGIQENGVNMQISEYNDMVLQRNRIMQSSTELNPTVVRINNQIDQVKASILQSLQRLRNNLRISEEDVTRQVRSIGSKILAVPSQEREYRGIERQQSIKEALYLYLLQKREENSLALAVTAPKAKIVDSAHSTGYIVSPNSKSVLLGTIALGLFIPFSILYIKGMMDNKIYSRSDIEELSREITIVGELPKVKEKEEIMIGKNDRSMLSESFRFLITNLQFLLLDSKKTDKGRKILITSSIKGEGKTFTALNLAITLANNERKVLLIGADLRNPKLQMYIENSESNKAGLSNYLTQNKICIKNLIKKSTINSNLSILGSGSIPPNPSELLRQEKLSQMFLELEDIYDYIIIDSAPSMLVTDTFLINKHVDITLYLVKAGYTDKDLLEFALDAKNNGTMPKINFILNNVQKSDLGFGNKYGYGYGEQKKPAFSWRTYF
ncbi:GumC family protein [Christiangramia echinicola]|uniref:GumC family protein n=1 Tax=Christiangramia echinicola TaxID=279359 RepID=UPI000422A6C0|nr:polysaccharide biosynthesis tyrosine autokinase [Christiangramia echinicola]